MVSREDVQTVAMGKACWFITPEQEQIVRALLLAGF